MFLSGKRALVTGSTSGIGLAIARALAAEGAKVVLNGFGDAGEIAKLQDEIGAGYSAADLTRPEAIEAMIAEAGDIDILVNNAGMQHGNDEGNRLYRRLRRRTADPIRMASRCAQA